MISLFPLWTFRLNVATFQQYLHNYGIYISQYDIPELVVPIWIFFDYGLLLNKEAIIPSYQKNYDRRHDFVNLYGTCMYICAKADSGNVSFVVVIILPVFPLSSVTMTGFWTIITRRLSLVEQEILQFRNNWVHDGFYWGPCCSMFSFLCSILCPFFFGSCIVCLLLLLITPLVSFTASDYTFGIFKLFFLGFGLLICFISNAYVILQTLRSIIKLLYF
jgi:hypothetical protein